MLLIQKSNGFCADQEKKFRRTLLEIFKEDPLILYVIVRFGTWKPRKNRNGSRQELFDPRGLIKNYEEMCLKLAKFSNLVNFLIRTDRAHHMHDNPANAIKLTREGRWFFNILKDKERQYIKESKEKCREDFDYVRDHYGEKEFVINFLKDFKIIFCYYDFIYLEFSELFGKIPRKFINASINGHDIDISYRVEWENFTKYNNSYVMIELKCHKTGKNHLFSWSKAEIKGKISNKGDYNLDCTDCGQRIKVQHNFREVTTRGISKFTVEGDFDCIKSPLINSDDSDNREIIKSHNSLEEFEYDGSVGFQDVEKAASIIEKQFEKLEYDAIKEAKNHAREKKQSCVNSYIITNFLMKQYKLFFKKNYRNQIDRQIFESELKEFLRQKSPYVVDKANLSLKDDLQKEKELKARLEKELEAEKLKTKKELDEIGRIIRANFYEFSQVARDYVFNQLSKTPPRGLDEKIIKDLVKKQFEDNYNDKILGFNENLFYEKLSHYTKSKILDIIQSFKEKDKEKKKAKLRKLFIKKFIGFISGNPEVEKYNLLDFFKLNFSAEIENINQPTLQPESFKKELEILLQQEKDQVKKRIDSKISEEKELKRVESLNIEKTEIISNSVKEFKALLNEEFLDQLEEKEILKATTDRFESEVQNFRNFSLRYLNLRLQRKFDEEIKKIKDIIKQEDHMRKFNKYISANSIKFLHWGGQEAITEALDSGYKDITEDLLKQKILEQYQQHVKDKFKYTLIKKENFETVFLNSLNDKLKSFIIMVRNKFREYRENQAKLNERKKTEIKERTNRIVEKLRDKFNNFEYWGRYRAISDCIKLKKENLDPKILKQKISDEFYNFLKHKIKGKVKKAPILIEYGKILKENLEDYVIRAKIEFQKFLKGDNNVQSANLESKNREVHKDEEYIENILKDIRKRFPGFARWGKSEAEWDAIKHEKRRIDRKVLSVSIENEFKQYYRDYLSNKIKKSVATREFEKELKQNLDYYHAQSDLDLKRDAPYLKFERLKYKGVELSKPNFLLLIKRTTIRNYDSETFFKKLNSFKEFKKRKIKLTNGVNLGLYFKLVKLGRRFLKYFRYCRLICIFSSWSEKFTQEFRKNLTSMFINMILGKGAGEDFPITSGAQLSKKIDTWNSQSKYGPLYIEEGVLIEDIINKSSDRLLHRKLSEKKFIKISKIVMDYASIPKIGNSHVERIVGKISKTYQLYNKKSEIRA